MPEVFPWGNPEANMLQVYGPETIVKTDCCVFLRYCSITGTECFSLKHHCYKVLLTEASLLQSASHWSITGSERLSLQYRCSVMIHISITSNVTRYSRHKRNATTLLQTVHTVVADDNSQFTVWMNQPTTTWQYTRDKCNMSKFVCCNQCLFTMFSRITHDSSGISIKLWAFLNI